MAHDPMYASLLPYAPERDVYRLLQVDPNANEVQIAAACRRLALTFHPDYNRSPRAHEEMQIVNAVRSLLSDPRARAVYDGARRRYLHDGFRPKRVLRRQASSVSVAAGVTPFAARVEATSEPLHVRARRMGLALVAAVRNALAELGPARCPSCHLRVEPDYRYCASCGTWVGRTKRLPGG
jgi:curved DNA-binding protein CbpA